MWILWKNNKKSPLSSKIIFEILEGTETLWSKEKMVIAEILTEILHKIPRIEIVTLEVNCPVRIWRIEFPEEREEEGKWVKKGMTCILNRGLYDFPRKLY